MRKCDLPVTSKADLDIQPIDWTGINRRYMNPGELETLLALVRLVYKPTAILEFGCNEGRTAKALLDNVLTLEHYQGIDVLPGYVASKPVQRREVPPRPGYLAQPDPRFELILRKRGSLDLTAADLKPCSVAFIDGDHGRATVMHDTYLAMQCVLPGGMIIWHDYHDIGNVDVRECLHELSDGGMKMRHVAGTWFVYHVVPLRFDLPEMGQDFTRTSAAD